MAEESQPGPIESAASLRFSPAGNLSANGRAEASCGASVGLRDLQVAVAADKRHQALPVRVSAANPADCDAVCFNDGLPQRQVVGRYACNEIAEAVDMDYQATYARCP